MIERRRHARRAIQYRVTYESADVHGKSVAQDIGLVVNVSEKGMLLESAQPIHAATVRVILPAGDHQPLQVTGDVVYSIPVPPDRYRTGIVFHDSLEKSSGAVARLLESATAGPAAAVE